MKLIGVLNIQETKRELIYSSAILEEFRNVASFVFFFILYRQTILLLVVVFVSCLVQGKFLSIMYLVTPNDEE